MTKNLLLAALLMAALAAEAKEPKYTKPDVAAPAAWQSEAPFGIADPRDSLPKGKWWTIYNDADLNAYEEHALAANQSLQSAIARLREARASARVAQAGLFPEFDASPSVVRQRVSGNRPNLSSYTSPSPITQTVFTLPFTLNYELDLFGEVRNNVRAAQASLQATAADLENVRLILTSDVAADYFEVHSLDSEIADVKEAIAYEQKGLDLVEERHRGGIASGLDVAQQQTELDSAVTQLSLLQQQRDQYQHALAVLQGIPAPEFVAPAHPLQIAIPKIPVALPSQLLERRPDIAAAERSVASANAEIGLARAAFFPRIFLGASGGTQSISAADLFASPSAVWSVGASALQAIFSGGKIHARYEQTKAVYDESVADYRESVLVSFQQVEDALSALNRLATALQSQERAVADARRSLDLANARYTGGLVSYLDVITAQEQLLANQRLATQLLGQRVVTSVYLIKAIGGGWDASTLNNVPTRATFHQAIQQ